MIQSRWGKLQCAVSGHWHRPPVIRSGCRARSFSNLIHSNVSVHKICPGVRSPPPRQPFHPFLFLFLSFRGLQESLCTRKHLTDTGSSVPFTASAPEESKNNTGTRTPKLPAKPTLIHIFSHPMACRAPKHSPHPRRRNPAPPSPLNLT
jgi:hypothetical protein